MGGPAYNCQQLSKGDILLKVDDEPVHLDSFHDKLVGCDVPGSSVKLTVFSPSKNEEKEVTLTRMATTTIADNVRMFELFTSLKVSQTFRFTGWPFPRVEHLREVVIGNHSIEY